MTTYKVIKLHNLEEIQDRAIKGLIIPQERLRSMPSPYAAKLYDAFLPNPFYPDSRNLTEKKCDHQEYDCALVVTECEEGEPVRYAIYKGTQEECYPGYNRFEESKRNLEGYRQNGNGTRRRNIQ